MSGYEVFDNEEVQFVTRKQAGQISALVVTASVLTVMGLSMGFMGALPLAFVVAVLAAFWLAAFGWIVQRLHTLRQVMWCLKISDERVVGYNYLRQATTLEWDATKDLHLKERGVLLEGADGHSIFIPHLYSDFHRISHRLLQHALWNGTPLFVNGRDWQQVDVYELYPFLQPAYPGEDG
ncbi:MAG: hypothetical protein AAGI71_09960 [Bacteroidota bacterium]